MRTMIGALVGAVLLAAVGGAASAEPDGDDYTFTLYNRSGQTVLTFQTARTNGSWSNDWIPTRVVEDGDDVDMRFFNSEDECEYDTKVVMEDGSEYYETIDYCEIEDVYVTEDGFYAE
ncbi:hypothetical protein [Brevundimonas sp.]|uniref:hypothetical protein n=1 Tax=Brevundimonas sp. TaxID=1871086 RepID=UPI0037851928